MAKNVARQVAIIIVIGTGLWACGPSDSMGDVDAAVCTLGATQPCYSGAPGTEGVGPCIGGQIVCESTGWSSCQDEVVPTVELCTNNNVDEDCNGLVDDVPDLDGDGWTICTGDCCETLQQCADPFVVNPGAIEVATPMGETPGDENCNGLTDEPAVACDDLIALADADPNNGARAIDLCHFIGDGDAFGVMSAAYVRANGAPSAASWASGITDLFGPNVPPQSGNRMLVLSSGRARSFSQPNACGSLTCTTSGAGTAPPGFPQDVPGCLGGTNINDDMAFEVELKAPSNAKGLSFDFIFYTFEYPEWVCTTFNDQFIALMTPWPQGSINGNISFDSASNPVSVNIALFDVCAGCAQGTGALVGTGFDVWDDAGATGWLRSTAPVEGGQTFTMRFAIWDTGDQAWDSTVLIDNFQWIADSVAVGTAPVP